MKTSPSPLILSPPRLWLIAGLMLLSTVLYLIGSAVERNQAVVGEAPGAHNEAEETHEGGAANHESLFGINTDSPWIVGTAALVWLVLIIALFRYGQRMLAVIILTAVVATILDIREVMAQVSNSNAGVATLAGAVVLTHATVALVAGLTLWQSGASPRKANADS